MKKKSYRIKRDPLDALFSTMIRARDGWKCQRCGSTPNKGGLHCHHYKRRRKQSTRFDEDNCVSLCFGCHEHLKDNRDEEDALMLKRLGQERLDALSERAMKLKKVDRIAVKEYIKEKLKEME